MLYSPGELFDKCSILEIKMGKGLPVKDEFALVKSEIDALTKMVPSTNELYFKILDSNIKQYALEDRIRVEKTMTKVGKIALEIRVQNDIRVSLKNEINKATGYRFREEKKYLSKDDGKETT